MEKAFIGFPDVKLLGKHVNGFGVATHDEELEAIRALKIPKTLKQLGTYLGRLGWFRAQTALFAVKLGVLCAISHLTILPANFSLANSIRI